MDDCLNFELSFQGGGDVEFAKQLKSVREDTGADLRVVRALGQFPPGQPEIITLFIESRTFVTDAEGLRKLILAHVAHKKTKEA